MLGPSCSVKMSSKAPRSVEFSDSSGSGIFINFIGRVASRSSSVVEARWLLFVFAFSRAHIFNMPKEKKCASFDPPRSARPRLAPPRLHFFFFPLFPLDLQTQSII